MSEAMTAARPDSAQAPADPVTPQEEWQALRDAGQLLSAVEMATFVARGVLSFPALVPDAINHELVELAASGAQGGGGYAGEPLAGRWPDSHPVARMLALPRVRGIIASLVGPGPRHDHHALHTVQAGHTAAQGWHADATIDARESAFDIQLMWFPHDLPAEMGGTMILPGSHLRQVHEFEVSRYHHILGQQPTICPAGTIQVLHHGMWHRARGNATDRARYMFKLRLNPVWKQERLFDTTGHDGKEVGHLLNQWEPWFGGDARKEIVNRIRLWRHVTGDPTYDSSMWLGRLEAQPEARLFG